MSLSSEERPKRKRTYVGVGRRTLLFALVAAAPLADAAGAHGLAFWALVAAIPAAAGCALASFAAFLDDSDDVVGSLQALLWAPALVLLLTAAAARGPALATAGVPRLGVSALVGCLAVLALKGAVFACAGIYRGSVRASSSSAAAGAEANGWRAPVAVKPARS
jgi:hypothetical protein